MFIYTQSPTALARPDWYVGKHRRPARARVIAARAVALIIIAAIVAADHWGIFTP
jgi:hypothetical protein